jgi:hypothetical protein
MIPRTGRIKEGMPGTTLILGLRRGIVNFRHPHERFRLWGCLVCTFVPFVVEQTATKSQNTPHLRRKTR